MKGYHPFYVMRKYIDLRSMETSKLHITYVLFLTMLRVLALSKLKNNVIYMRHANGYVKYILVDLHLFPETMFLICFASEPSALKYLWELELVCRVRFFIRKRMGNLNVRYKSLPTCLKHAP